MGAESCLSTPQPSSPRPERVISLRNLSNAINAGRAVGLEKLTRLDGFVTDAQTQDILIWGLSEPGQPQLHLEDFAVALRAAHGRYGVRRGQTILMATPAISIDPNLEAIRELATINGRDTKRREKHARICSQAQTVRIEGMPRHTRVVKALVDADYRMKQVAQGTIELPIEQPFPGHFTLQVKKWREEIESGASRTLRPRNTRYWFEPGAFSCQASAEGDTVFLDTAQVVLRDEDRVVGTTRPSGNADPLAKAFTCAWSERMEDTFRAEQIWRDMYNVFRFFALARVMADRDVFRQVSFEGGALLERYEIPHVTVPMTLPGLGRWEEFERMSHGGERTSTELFSTYVCGGVRVGFTRPLDMKPDTGATQTSGRMALGSRPNFETVSWTATPGAENLVPQARPRSAPAEEPVPQSPSIPATPSLPWSPGARVKSL